MLFVRCHFVQHIYIAETRKQTKIQTKTQTNKQTNKQKQTKTKKNKQTRHNALLSTKAHSMFSVQQLQVGSKSTSWKCSSFAIMRDGCSCPVIWRMLEDLELPQKNQKTIGCCEHDTIDLTLGTCCMDLCSIRFPFELRANFTVFLV